VEAASDADPRPSRFRPPEMSTRQPPEIKLQRTGSHHLTSSARRAAYLRSMRETKVRHVEIVLATAIFFIGQTASCGVFFTENPRARLTAQGSVEITFEVSRPSDVEVAILDSKGEVVRHLAPGCSEIILRSRFFRTRCSRSFIGAAEVTRENPWRGIFPVSPYGFAPVLRLATQASRSRRRGSRTFSWGWYMESRRDRSCT